MKVTPVRAAQRLAPEVSVGSTFKDRVGLCYPLAGRYVIDHPRCQLVHGTIQGDGNPPIEHAWIILPDGNVWEVILQDTIEPDLYHTFFNAVEERRYTSREAAIAMLRAEHWGPWHTVSRPEARAMKNTRRTKGATRRVK